MLSRCLISGPILCALAVALTAQARPPADCAFADASDAWERGDYIGRLEGYLRLLESPAGEVCCEAVALTTGELYVGAVAPQAHREKSIRDADVDRCGHGDRGESRQRPWSRGLGPGPRGRQVNTVAPVCADARRRSNRSFNKELA